MEKIQILKKWGMPKFTSMRMPIDESFRPSATIFGGDVDHLTEKVRQEFYEQNDIKKSENLVINEMKPYTKRNKIIPLSLIPSEWNSKNQNDIDWYNSDDSRYVCFTRWDGKKVLIPAAISISLPFKKGLSWITYSGYAHDNKFEIAVEKGIMELIERDDFASWWHKGNGLFDVNMTQLELIKRMIKEVKISPNVKKVDLFEIPNEWGVITILCVIYSNEYPKISLGLGASFNLEYSCKHAILEAVGSYRGHMWEALNGEANVNMLRFEEIYKHILETRTNSRLNNNIQKYSIEKLMKKTQTYFSTINNKNGYTIKAYSTLLQPETMLKTTPFVSRLILRTDKPLKLGTAPFW
ncbi:YcaO-like family protein [Companilactobacillus paralimentarius]|uniref:YcaO-like family protein n=1 Tax=Companilactobacillus paralimentarius TaxID=83526 RepID=UPI00384AF8F3